MQTFNLHEHYPGRKVVHPQFPITSSLISPTNEEYSFFHSRASVYSRQMSLGSDFSSSFRHSTFAEHSFDYWLLLTSGAMTSCCF